ncbi:MAG: phosphoribosylglycinamide formyltransferase [Cyclobacteriaceae bacterium]
MIKIAVFASGSGTNAENLIQYFQDSKDFTIEAIFCNNPQAGVLERAKRLKIKSTTFSKSEFAQVTFLKGLEHLGIDAIVLAGFLWKVPKYLIQKFPDKIINIHPALLPKYGGKGMYGSKVHEAVIANGEKESGITIHLVNEEYDKGKILFQESCPVLDDDTSDDLANRIHQLEYKHFPQIVEDYLRQTLLKV